MNLDFLLILTFLPHLAYQQVFLGTVFSLFFQLGIGNLKSPFLENPPLQFDYKGSFFTPIHLILLFFLGESLFLNYFSEPIFTFKTDSLFHQAYLFWQIQILLLGWLSWSLFPFTYRMEKLPLLFPLLVLGGLCQQETYSWEFYTLQREFLFGPSSIPFLKFPESPHPNDSENPKLLEPKLKKRGLIKALKSKEILAKRETLQELVALYPEDFLILREFLITNRKVKGRFIRSDLEKVSHHFQKNPQFAAIRRFMAQLAMELEDFTLARLHFRWLFENRTLSTLEKACLAYCESFRDNPEVSFEMAQKVWESSSPLQNPQIARILGKTYFRLKAFKFSEKFHNLAGTPSNKEDLQELVQIYRELGKGDQEQKILKLLLKGSRLKNDEKEKFSNRVLEIQGKNLMAP